MPEGAVQVPPVQPPDPAIAALQAEVRRGQADLAALKRMATAPPQPVVQQAQPQGGMDPTALKAEFYKNPLEFTAAIAQNVAAGIVQENNRQTGAAEYDTLVSYARSQARAQDPEIFDRYQAEIEAMVAQLQPQFRKNINVWMNAFANAKGNHLREILEAEKQAAGQGNKAPAVHISQQGGPGQSSNAPTPGAAPAQLTPEERRVARKLGLSEAQYNHGKQILDGQSEKGPSSWDKLITTSSKGRRRDARNARLAAAAKK